MKNMLASHGSLEFGEEPEGLEGPRYFTEWRESDKEGEAGLMFQGELGENGLRHGRVVIMVGAQFLSIGWGKDH